MRGPGPAEEIAKPLMERVAADGILPRAFSFAFGIKRDLEQKKKAVAAMNLATVGEHRITVGDMYEVGDKIRFLVSIAEDATPLGFFKLARFTNSIARAHIAAIDRAESRVTQQLPGFACQSFQVAERSSWQPNGTPVLADGGFVDQRGAAPLGKQAAVGAVPLASAPLR